MKIPFLERLSLPQPILLDGATGTELSRRGIDLNDPSWTARAIRETPQILWEIHRDYVNAGAELITANTFRTHARNLECIGQSHDAGHLTREAVALARDAAGSNVSIAGSIAPLEDCYSPERTPDDSALLREHAAMADSLAQAGVDFLLVETQITIREGVIAARAAQQTGIPFGISFVCNTAGNLLSGESLVEAYRAVASLQPALFLVNCVPAEEVLRDLLPLREEAPAIPLGAYANTGRLLTDGTWEATEGHFPAVYAEHARHWIEAGLALLGGCCGTTPEHISQLREILYS